MERKKADEATPLIAKSKEDLICDHVANTYIGSHAEFTGSFDGRGHVIADYEPLKLSSFKVFCSSRGSVLRSPVIVIEQLLITMIFACFAGTTWFFFRQDMAGDMGSRKGALSVKEWLDKQEPKMRQFSMIMTGLAAFLLSFYTAMIVGRWWTMRCGGVGGIKTATVELEMYIHHLVTQEEKVIAAIRRYGRASLVLIFLWRRGQLKPEDKLKEILTYVDPEKPDDVLLYKDEADRLLAPGLNHNIHETIWAWQTGIVTMLYKEGKIRSDELLKLLLDRCSDGRAAVQLAHTHLAVRLPMQYVHLVGMLVKMHNLVLAIIMGMLFGAAVRNKDTIIMIQLFLRTLILPFLFNAILLINAELSDPFDGSESDFPGRKYEQTLDKDCRGLVSAAQNMPDWLSARTRRT